MTKTYTAGTLDFSKKQVVDLFLVEKEKTLEERLLDFLNFLSTDGGSLN